jgi:hypothetical protein
MTTQSTTPSAWRWPAVRLRWAAVAAAFFLLNALRLAATVALDLKASGSRTPWTKPLVWELTSAFIVWALVPLAQAVALNAPWKRVPWSRFLALHLAGALLFWTVHVAWMWASRTLIYKALGWGAYDYGTLAFRAPMEGLKDLSASQAWPPSSTPWRPAAPARPGNWPRRSWKPSCGRRGSRPSAPSSIPTSSSTP